MGPRSSVIGLLLPGEAELIREGCKPNNKKNKNLMAIKRKYVFSFPYIVISQMMCLVAKKLG